jgi:NCAIR mutase (PurE)-related protein
MKASLKRNLQKSPIAEIQGLLRGVRMARVGDAVLDIDRLKRKGFPEVVFAQGKKSGDIVQILNRLIEEKSIAVASRVDEKQAAVLQKEFSSTGRWYPDARVFLANRSAVSKFSYATSIGILTAGLSDRPVAEEAYQILHSANYPVVKMYDVGVSGLQRLLSQIHKIEKCDVVIVAAGMEGALPTVVAGLLEQPVIAVPTSIGYGISQNGLTALQTMLASCSPGMAVVNIDNGYGAAMMAHAICMRIHKGKRAEK